jgi:hypothetical protein
MDSRHAGRAARLLAACAWGLSLPAAALGARAASAKEAPVKTPAWAWEKSTYLGSWKATLAWPELARCWQRYGGDGMEIAAAPPRAQAQRPIALVAFPRHADFDRKRQAARREGPYPEQLAALGRLNAEGAATADRILDAVHAYFLDHDYDAVAEEAWNDEGKANLPRLKKREAIGETLELKEVQLHSKWRDGLSYVGLIFETRWDDGHGLGVLIHGDRIVQVGGSATAFNPSQWDDGELEEPREPWLRP